MNNILREVADQEFHFIPLRGSYNIGIDISEEKKGIGRTEDKNRIQFDFDEGKKLIPLFKKYLDIEVQCQGVFLYSGKGSGIGWHTDEDRPGDRYYLIHCDQADKSYFQLGEQIFWDKEGWNINHFNSGMEHRVVNLGCTRLSIGFKKLN